MTCFDLKNTFLTKIDTERVLNVPRVLGGGLGGGVTRLGLSPKIYQFYLLTPSLKRNELICIVGQIFGFFLHLYVLS